MHSLRSIEKLNELAEGNHNAKRLLEEANRSREGKPSPFETATDAALAKLRTAGA